MIIYLLDPKSEIFQTFQTADQLYGFCQRSTRNMKGKTLIVRNGPKAVCSDLGDETPTEIHTLTLHIMNSIRS